MTDMTLKEAMKQHSRAWAMARLASIKMEDARLAIEAAEQREDMTSCGVQVCHFHLHGNFNLWHPAKRDTPTQAQP